MNRLLIAYNSVENVTSNVYILITSPEQRHLLHLIVFSLLCQLLLMGLTPSVLMLTAFSQQVTGFSK